MNGKNVKRMQFDAIIGINLPFTVRLTDNCHGNGLLVEIHL
jgi:hypothetical protein